MSEALEMTLIVVDLDVLMEIHFGEEKNLFQRGKRFFINMFVNFAGNRTFVFNELFNV